MESEIKVEREQREEGVVSEKLGVEYCVRRIERCKRGGADGHVGRASERVSEKSVRLSRLLVLSLYSAGYLLPVRGIQVPFPARLSFLPSFQV